MKALQLKNKTLTSIEVAEMVDKRHTDLLRDIRNYIEQMEENNQRKIASVDFFIESSYKDKKGEKRPCYLITKKGCEFIANKLTGTKGTLFTATYINRFNEMEEFIKETSNIEEMKIKASQDRAKAMLLNAQNRALKTLMKTMENKQLSPVAIEVFGLKSIEQLTGVDMGNYLLKVDKTYTATEIGEMLGISANKVGVLAKQHNLKTEKYGIWVVDKSKYSNKEVSTFRYFQNALDTIKKLAI